MIEFLPLGAGVMSHYAEASEESEQPTGPVAAALQALQDRFEDQRAIVRKGGKAKGKSNAKATTQVQLKVKSAGMSKATATGKSELKVQSTATIEPKATGKAGF